MSTFNIGLKTLRKMLETQNAIEWHRAKLTKQLFKGLEVEVFEWVDAHLYKYHHLPSLETAIQQHPELDDVTCPEPVKYYVDLLDRRFIYDSINKTNLDTQALLKEDKSAVDEAEMMMRKALDNITYQRYRNRIMEMGSEASKLILSDYHKLNQEDIRISFGWEYMDDMTNGLLGGDVVSFVGRPASGKTFLILRLALHNWMAGNNILLASMEMNHLAIAQRVSAMYAHTGIGQLKMAAYSSHTYDKFSKGLSGMQNEKGKFYVVDGNLAANADDLYMLAAQLQCSAVLIDGAYLLKHKNPRLDRFTKVAENVEMMKQLSTDLNIPTIASWQFNRQAAKKGKGVYKNEKAGLEDIGYSDAIPQVSSVVLGLHQEEGVETIQSRVIDVMKGRNGEVGNFKIAWDFINMNFDQLEEDESEDMDYV